MSDRKRVFVTGHNGFIGKNLCLRLKELNKYEVLTSEKGDAQSFEKACAQADFVIHLAGVNRPKTQDEFVRGNFDYTKDLVAQLEKRDVKPPIVFASSIQAGIDHPYGKSKRLAEKEIFRYAKRSAVACYVYRLPNVFGKWCRPFYNSVVATWCNQLSHGQDIRIDDPFTKLHLVYIDDVVDEFIVAMESKATSSHEFRGFYQVLPIYNVTLDELSQRLRSFVHTNGVQTMPEMDELNRKLYAQFLSSKEENALCYELDQRADERGKLAEFIKQDGFGQIFVSTTKPGITRGNHYHHTKTEKFFVLSGQARIVLTSMRDGQTVTFDILPGEMRVVDIPPGCSHTITNIGSDPLVTLFYASEIFDMENSDTFAFDSKLILDPK